MPLMTLMIGNTHLSGIGTLVEHQTRMLRLVHLPRSDTGSLAMMPMAGSTVGLWSAGDVGHSPSGGLAQVSTIPVLRSQQHLFDDLPRLAS